MGPADEALDGEDLESNVGLGLRLPKACVLEAPVKGIFGLIRYTSCWSAVFL